MACGVFGFGLTPDCVATAFADAAIRVIAFIGGVVLLILAVWFVAAGKTAAAVVASAAAIFLLTGPFGVLIEAIVLLAFYLARRGQPGAAAGVVVFGLVLLFAVGGLF